jgi:repressor of nif and glnA expression
MDYTLLSEKKQKNNPNFNKMERHVRYILEESDERIIKKELRQRGYKLIENLGRSDIESINNSTNKREGRSD